MSAVKSLIAGLEGLKNYKYWVVYFDKELQRPNWVSFDTKEEADKLSQDRLGVVLFGEYISHGKDKEKKDKKEK